MEDEVRERERLECLRRAVYEAVLIRGKDGAEERVFSQLKLILDRGGMEGALLDLIEGSLMLVVNGKEESQWARTKKINFNAIVTG